MLTAHIYTDKWDVGARLSRFDTTRDELIEVVRKTHGERSSSISVDPLSAPGQLSYIGGTRHTRLLFMPKGWVIDREKNIESVIQPDLGLKIAYQNVDIAASHDRSPRAISGKRSGSAKMIEEAQGCLFGSGGLPEAVPTESLARLNSALWYLCVSFNGDDVRAELSLPAAIKDNNFHGFLERIFLIQRGEWDGLSGVILDRDDKVEFEPKISRK